MGITGSGKSTFISHLSEVDVEVGHTLESCTQEIAIYPALVGNGKRIFLMDTPGFDDPNVSDAMTLKKIATKLGETRAKGVLLSGLVYLHRISDNRLSGVARKNLRMFKALCGEKAMENVALATTFWDQEDGKVGVGRESELCKIDTLWKSMKKRDSVFRHDDGKHTARAIIEFLVNKNSKVETDIVTEMRDGSTKLEQTTAGREVETLLAGVMKELADTRKELDVRKREALATQNKEELEEIRMERAELEQKTDRSQKDLQLLQMNNVQLAEQLRDQREKMADNARTIQVLEDRERKREKRIWRKYNPFRTPLNEREWFDRK
ncbi:hypothetical protein LTR56_015996 [Elasticomyces elasticus]|nr:hypothetical protein LTR56_015996 [Elasticomyces elasticus]